LIARPGFLDGVDLHKLQQVVKWIVYSLLLINWGFYIEEDWSRALHTLGPDATLVQWAAEFATSIDEAGWFILLFMFELETYVLEDESWTGWTAAVVHGTRLLCYVMLLHTVYAFTNGVIDIQPTVEVENATSLCDLVDGKVSYVYNLEYTLISPENCNTLSDADRFYHVGDGPVVATADGLRLEKQHAWADLVEAVAWLIIVLAIELVVRLQERDITSGRTILIANRLKAVCYAILVILAAWWAWLSHWLYTWDEFLWIAGFAAIEMNINEWRGEIEEEKVG
jgi:hypothetical protein